MMTHAAPIGTMLRPSVHTNIPSMPSHGRRHLPSTTPTMTACAPLLSNSAPPIHVQPLCCPIQSWWRQGP